MHPGGMRSIRRPIVCTFNIGKMKQHWSRSVSTSGNLMTCDELVLGSDVINYG